MPGRWRITIETEISGMPMKIQPLAYERCIRADEAKDPQHAVPHDPKDPCAAKDTKVTARYILKAKVAGISRRTGKASKDVYAFKRHLFLPHVRMKTVGVMRKTRHRGLHKMRWVFTFAATAYNLVRMRNLIHPRVQAA